MGGMSEEKRIEQNMYGSIGKHFPLMKKKNKSADKKATF